MPIESGNTLAHYRLVELIGEGGMGVVWKALDTNLDREVAIKILPEAFSADPLRLARFEREAKLLALLNHPNIATIFGLHEQDGIRFLAMELIPGEDLSRRLQHKKPTVMESMSIARQIAAALEATHERGVIHRDLKPANIYVTPSGEVKVLDFGIARDIEPDVPLDDPAAVPDRTPSHTEPGTILGTVSYMSPEQARGKPLDPRTDIWSFGCVLFRMLAGEAAFDGETRWDRLAAVLREEPDWSVLPAETPPPVRVMLQRCLEKKAEQRLAEASEARQILDSAIAAEVTGEMTTGPGPPFAESSPSRRTQVAVGIAMLLLIVSLITWKWIGPGESGPGGGAADRRSIAVLPFQNVGNVEENEAFTAGIHDDILNQIAKIGDLKVISRTSVMEYRDAAQNVQQVGNELGVATVLEGTVQRAENQVRINVQLIDTASAEALWAEDYTRELTTEGIFSIQSDIAERIATALEATLSPALLEDFGDLPTDDMAAYDLYTQGLDYVTRTGYLPDNLLTAIDLFEEAIARDPAFAKAHVELARASTDYYWLGGGDPEDLDAGIAAAERALELEPDLPEAHLALGTCHYVQRHYERALEELDVAETGMPGSSELIRRKAYVMRRLGRWDDAVDGLRRAHVLNPRDAEAAHEVGMTLMCLRRYEEAETYFETALSLAEDYPLLHLYRAMNRVLADGSRETVLVAFGEIDAIQASRWKWANGWELLLALGEHERAIEFVTPAPRDRVKGQWYDYPTQLLIGWTYSLQGRDDEATPKFEDARAILEADVKGNPEDPRVHASLGIAYAGLGMKEDALREGRRAVELMPIEKDVFVGAWMMRDLALIYTMTGELDAAAEAIDRVLSVPSVWSIESVLIDPRIDPLRDHPAFLELVDKYRG
jgi:serine/threonine protein kinase/tetratricopeptide (TPR) repeat protein